MKLILAIAVLSAGILTSCKKETASEYNSNTKAALSVEFDNITGSSDLELNTGTYTNATGENFTVTKLKYYVSNFVLTNTNGAQFTVPQDSCYFLIDESDETTHEPVLHVPEGEYKTLTFTLGIDSARNAADISIRTGVLDPAAAASNMYQGLNKGYIFFKMEGKSPVSAATGNSFMYNIGGFSSNSSGSVNNIKTITLDLTARGTPKVKTGKETNIHLMIDIIKMFSGVATVSIAQHPVVMFDPYSINIANNLAGMFRHDHTEN